MKNTPCCKAPVTQAMDDKDPCYNKCSKCGKPVVSVDGQYKLYIKGGKNGMAVSPKTK